MTNMLIIAVMVITLMGAATYGMVGAMRSLQTGIETLLNEDRLEEAAQGVLANIVSVTTNSAQVYYVPAPDSLSAPAVPSWITPNAQNLRGVKFLYCPFSNATGSGSATITTPNSSYTVNIGQTYVGTNVSSNNYVIQSSTQPTITDNSGFQSKALAVLVAPGSGQTALLSTQDCLSISTTGTLPGATVRVITAQEVQSRAQVVASYGNEFYAGSSTSGDGRGSSSYNYATFATVMDYVNKYRPQRVTVNLQSGATIGVNANDMDQTTVTGRQFSSVRNHSIFYNGFTGSSNLQSNITGTLSPVTFGNVQFQNINFPAVNNKLLRPMADSFGNISFDRFEFMAAENLGRAVTPGAQMPNAASSPTGNEMQYSQRGGVIEYDNDTYGPPSSYANYLTYGDFGGSTYFSGNFYYGPGNNSSTSMFFTGGGGVFVANNFTQPNANFSGQNIFSTIYNDIGSKSYFRYLFSVISPAVYNQGGLFYTPYIIAYGTDNSGNVTGSNPATHAQAYSILAGPGSNFDVALSVGNTYPTVADALTNSSTAPYRAASFLANAYFYGSQSGATQCFSDLTSYNMESDAGNVSGVSVAPKGNIGMEAATILNRSRGSCN